MTDVIIGQIITGTVSIVVALISWSNNRKISKVASKVDGLLEEKSAADKAIGNIEGQKQRKEEQAPLNEANIEAAKALGNLEGRQGLKDESKPIKPK